MSDIQRNIVKEIMRECYPKHITVNEKFVEFFVKLLLLDPNWRITNDFMNSRANLQKLVKYVITQLEQQDVPNMLTLKIQYYFSCNMIQMERLVENNRSDLLKRLAPLKNDIIKTKYVSTQSEVETLTKKIVVYITLVCGLGNTSIPEVYQEALKAFNSTMQDQEIIEFAKKEDSEKEKDLVQFAKVVCGIRLFNKDCGNGGFGVANVPNLLEAAVVAVKESVEKVLSGVIKVVMELTAVVNNYYKATLDPLKSAHAISTIEKSMYVLVADEKEMEKAKDLLLFHRQYEVYIREILDRMVNLKENSDAIVDCLEETIASIHDLVYMKIGVPANVVFPLFEELADQWSDLQKQVIVLVNYRYILVNLQRYARSLKVTEEPLLNMYEKLITLIDQRGVTKPDTLRSKRNNLKVYKSSELPEVTTNFHGFCPWSLVKTKGALIPGDLDLGIVNYKDMYLTFASQRVFMEFSKRPDDFINGVLHLARKNPQLINYFQIKDKMKEVRGVEKLVRKYVPPKVCVDVSIQFSGEEHSKNKNYCWNVWDAKRQALKLANLSKCQTVATQTVKSHSLNAVKTQTYYKKTKETQTKSSNYTNVPKPANFIFGLRGKSGRNQFTIDLTRPVRE